MSKPTEKITNAELQQIIDSHEKGHCMVIRAFADYNMAKELLAVRETAPYGYLREHNGQVQISIGPIRPADRASGDATFWGAVYAAPPALPANVIGRPATPDDSPYPATISGGCLLAQAWADGYNVRNAATASPAVPAGFKLVPAEPTPEMIAATEIDGDEYYFESDEAAETWMANKFRAMIAAAPTPTK